MSLRALLMATVLFCQVPKTTVPNPPCQQLTTNELGNVDLGQILRFKIDTIFAFCLLLIVTSLGSIRPSMSPNAISFLSWPDSLKLLIYIYYKIVEIEAIGGWETYWIK